MKSSDFGFIWFCWFVLILTHSYLVSIWKALIHVLVLLPYRAHLKPGPVGSSDGHQRFIGCRYSSSSDGYGSLVPSDHVVLCSLLMQYDKRYIKELILLLFLSGCSAQHEK